MAEYRERKFLVDELLWVTREGTVIHVEDMTDGHLFASIMKIKKSPTLWRIKMLPVLEAEQQRRNGGNNG